MDGQLLPFTQLVQLEPYDPPRRLWHVPNSLPMTCPLCSLKVEKSKISFGGHDWHPQCFACSLCRQPFVNVQSCISKDDLILHHQCFLDCFADRCAKCTKVIDPSDRIQRIGKSYHTECFSCTKCGAKGDKMHKAMPVYGFPYCYTCFQQLEAYFPKCLVCQNVIYPGHDVRSFLFRGKKYFIHNPECFKCTICSKPLQAKGNCVYDNRLICKECYDEGFRKICASCNEPIFGQVSRLENIFWHPNHFICSVCHQPLKPNFTVFSGGVLKCRSCSTEDHAKCAGCHKPVVSGGIFACGAIWHPNCLKCQFCNEPCFNKKFTNIRDRPCCEECFNRLKADGRIDKRGHLITQKKSHKEPMTQRSKSSKKFDGGDYKSKQSHHHH